jgi:hypothetical protein
MTKPQLAELAKEKTIEIKSSWKKDQIIDKIIEES